MRPPIITQRKDYDPFCFDGESEDETATLNVNYGMLKMRVIFCWFFFFLFSQKLDEMLCIEELHWTNVMRQAAFRTNKC